MSLNKAIILTIFLVGLVAFIVADIVLALNQERGDTLSEMVNWLGSWAMSSTVALCWLIGFVMGHLFWPQFRDVKDGQVIKPAIVRKAQQSADGGK